MPILTSDIICSIGGIDVLELMDVEYIKDENKFEIKLLSGGSRNTGPLCNLIDSKVKLIIENKDYGFVLHGEYVLDGILPTLAINDIVYTTIYLSKNG